MTYEDEAFQDAILSAPDDEAPHGVYGDWLDEHDRPEEATWHRAWRTADAKAAREWFDRFATGHMQPYEGDSVYTGRDIIEHARDYFNQSRRGLEWPDRHVQQGSESLRDEFYNDQLRAEFWKFFALATGMYVGEAEAKEWAPFCCTC